MQFKQVGKLFEGEEWKSIITGGGLKANNFRTASSISDMENITAEMFNKQFKINSSGISEFNKSQIEAKANAIGLTDSLKNEVLAMASDADITDKLRSGKLTWSKAIDKADDSINDVGEALIKSGKLGEENGKILRTIMDQGDTRKTTQRLKDMVNEVDGLGDSLVTLESVASSKSGFFSSAANLGKGLLASLKAIAPYLGVAVATFAAFKIFDYAMTGYSRAQNKLSESSSKYEETKSELQSLNSQLNETKSRMEELRSKNKNPPNQR